MQRGAAIDLAAVARGGGEEQLEWALGALHAAGQPCDEVGTMGPHP